MSKVTIPIRVGILVVGITITLSTTPVVAQKHEMAGYPPMEFIDVDGAFFWDVHSPDAPEKRQKCEQYGGTAKAQISLDNSGQDYYCVAGKSHAPTPPDLTSRPPSALAARAAADERRQAAEEAQLHAEAAARSAKARAEAEAKAEIAREAKLADDQMRQAMANPFAQPDKTNTYTAKCHYAVLTPIINRAISPGVIESSSNEEEKALWAEMLPYWRTGYMLEFDGDATYTDDWPLATYDSAATNAKDMARHAAELKGAELDQRLSEQFGDRLYRSKDRWNDYWYCVEVPSGRSINGKWPPVNYDGRYKE